MFWGIDFVPFNEPLHRRFETFFAGFFIIIVAFGPYIFTIPFIYLLFTSYWWITLATIIVTYLDRNTCEEGGRPISWIQNWSCFRSAGDYFNGQVIYDDGFELESKKNYLFCVFPHGLIVVGPNANLFIKSSKFRELYPNFEVRFGVLKMLLFVPILKDIMMSVGYVACSFKSLSFLLSKPEGGNVVLLAVGGAEGCKNSSSGKYTFFVKKRKGFVKVAMKTGAFLVPVITFGENDLYDYIERPRLRKIQELVKEYLGFFPFIFNGRGLFQNSFGLFPRRKQLTTVLGKPIEIQQVNNPKDEEVDHLHAKFVKELEMLFEKYKHNCIENAENIHLEIL